MTNGVSLLQVTSAQDQSAHSARKKRAPCEHHKKHSYAGGTTMMIINKMRGAFAHHERKISEFLCAEICVSLEFFLQISPLSSHLLLPLLCMTIPQKSMRDYAA
jgi:hypothetical protein